MEEEQFAVFPDIKKELLSFDDHNYLYDHHLVKLENEDFEYTYYEYPPDLIDTKEHLLDDLPHFESEFCSNSNEAPAVTLNKGRFYSCKVCNLEFVNATDTFKHRAMFHARRKGNLCLICNIKFLSLKKYTSHMRKHVEHDVNKYFYCSICKTMFEKRRDLSAHLLSHMKTSIFCWKCNKYFRSNNQYRHHLKKFRTTYCCRICSSNFFFRKCYEQHMITHLRYDKLQCNNLRKHCYSNKRCLVIKRKQREIIKINFVSTPVKYRFHRSIYRKPRPPQKIFKCCKCLSTYATRNDLSKYIKHSKRKRHCFKCPLCKLGYCATKNLPSPTGNHTRRKLVSCRVSDLKFYDKNQKKKHTRELQLTKLVHDRKLVHQPDIPKIFLTCDLCNWKFPDAMGLKTHIYVSHF